MNNECQNRWGCDYLALHFPMAWLRGDYRRHCEDVLLNKEMSRMPATLQLVDNYKQCEALKEEIDKQRDEAASLRRRARELDISRWNKRARVERIVQSRYYSDGVGGAQNNSNSEASIFIRNCPVEDCRGYLSSDNICCVCDARVCSDCLCPVGEEDPEDHECDSTVLATVQTIRRESKPCPQCGIAISKIDGCHQMWCVQCHTAFNWNSGTVIPQTANLFHNPHHTDWLREMNNGTLPRQPGDVPCGGEIGLSYAELSNVLHHQRKASDEDCKRILKQYNHVSYLFRSIIPDLAHPGVDTDNSDLRIRYMLGHIDDKKMKESLSKREYVRHKELALRACYEAKVNAVVDVLHRFTVTTSMTIDEVCSELREIRSLMNPELVRISKHFNFTSLPILQFGPTI
jgi:hypothetical protein